MIFESYIQETGIAGLDGKVCCALLYHANTDNRFINQQMVNYCTKSTICKCELLYSDFEECDLVQVVNVTDATFV